MIHSYWVMVETSLKHGVKAGLFYLMPRLSNLMEHQGSMTGEMEFEKLSCRKIMTWNHSLRDSSRHSQPQERGEPNLERVLCNASLSHIHVKG